MENDSHIYELLSKGDEVAFSRFFQMYRQKVYHFVFLVVKVREIAEEITTDVFLKIWQKRTDLPGVHDMDAFLFIISKRKALDFLKKASRDKKIQQLISENLPKSADASSAAFEYRELAETVFSSLSPQRKHILTLSRVDGLSHKEISDKLNISPQTVKNTISQTLKLLESRKQKYWIDACCFILFLALAF